MKKLKKFILLFIFSFLFLSSCSWPTSQSARIQVYSSVTQKEVAEQQALPLGKTPQFQIKIQDEKHSICKVTTSLIQNNRILQLEMTPAQSSSQEPVSETYSISSTSLQDAGFQEGTAQLNIYAQNCSLFKGETEIQKPVQLDFTPPQVALTSSQHYINQGGADLATYTVTPDAVWSGIKIGPYAFRGYPVPDSNQNEHFAFFVFSYELSQETNIEVIAIDEAGNKNHMTLTPAKLFTKNFRTRSINIQDQFIATKVADVITNTPSLTSQDNPRDNFLLVNRDLRKQNAQFLMDLAAKSEPIFYWKDAFLPLSNASIEANFADFRNYYYQGEKIDEQTHLGFDMAVVKQYPISASANGKVIFSDYFGIYGNTVILDHGYGIMTLYAHLSRIDVQEGDLVKKGQKLGHSGETGLAGGDHLHYSLLIQGVQSNPIEFWDQHWIQDHVYLRLNPKLFTQQLSQN